MLSIPKAEEESAGMKRIRHCSAECFFLYHIIKRKIFVDQYLSCLKKPKQDKRRKKDVHKLFVP